MNKYCKLVVSVLLCCFLAGCSDTDNSSHSPSFSSNASKPQIESNSNIKLISATYFNNNAAPVTYKLDESGNKFFGVLNTDGKLTPVIIDGANKFEGLIEFDDKGYSYINYCDKEEKYGFVIIDTAGNITYQSGNDSEYKVKSGRDGYYLVVKMVRSMDISEDFYGIIDSSGHWIMEPQPNSFYCNDHSAEEEYSGAYFLGGSYFVVRWQHKHSRKTTMAVYDVETNSLIEVPTNTEDIELCNDTFICTDSDKNVFRLNKDGTVKPLITGYTHIDCYDNLIYCQSEYGNYGNFIDANGNVVRDLQKYDYVSFLNDENNKFDGGYATLLIRGLDDNLYLEIIDTNAKCSFEPIKLSGHAGFFIDGLALAKLFDGRIVWVDKDGNTTDCDPKLIELIEQDGDSFYMLVFKGGYTPLTINDERCIISRTGEKMNIYLE